MVVSVPTLQMQKNERIVGFEMRIRSGRIAQLPNVPIGWSFSVDNDPSWNTDVKGSIMVGAAALSADFLRRFVVVETEKDAPSDMPFALEGEVVVTTDFLVQRTIRLSTKDSQTEARKAPASTKPHVQGVSPPSLQ
jgi:predicted RecB family nuclease